MIFSQLMDFLPSSEFRRCVDCYNGNHKLQRFSCWDQFLCMAFAQLTYRESLRDIEACLRSAGTKLYHMGIRGGVARNTLANANQVRVAHLRRLRPNADCDGTPALHWRRLWYRTSRDRIRARFDDDRFVPVAVPLGQVPEARWGREDTH